MHEHSHLFKGKGADQFVINPNSEDKLVCFSYRDDQFKAFLYYLLAVLSCGTSLLLTLWHPELECYIKKKKCTVSNAQAILVQNYVKQWFVCRIETKAIGHSNGSGLPVDSSEETDGDESDTVGLIAKYNKQQNGVSIKYFDHQHVRYIWDQALRSYIQLTDLSTGTKCNLLQEQYSGLSNAEQRQKLVLFGPNKVNVEVKSYWRLFIEEVMNPFYIFQIFSILLWSFDEYYYYAAAIFLISAISCGIALHEIKKQSLALHDMVVSSDNKLIEVSRGNGVYEEVSNEHLVPGDVIVVPTNGCTMMCDAVLQAGTCIVNESMLTGESVPVTKTPLTQQEDDELYSTDVHKRHTLFSGTHVMQTRYYGNTKVTAVVVRTGFRTAKGELVRSILFPKPLDFQFYKDAMKFILFLAAIAGIGMTYTVVIYIKDGVHPVKIILRVLDVITIIVPAALPAAMTVGIAFAQSRLKTAKIFCISPPRINFCGRLDVFCFDKTGTLTEDGLDLLGVIPAQDSKFFHLEIDPSKLEYGPTLVCMASCHSLTLICGEMSGDPLDLIMFDSTKWALEEPGRDSSKFDTMMPTVVKPINKHTFLQEQRANTEPQPEVGIIRQFTFSSNMQRMSVIARSLGKDSMDLYCKGAPEKIASLCIPESVPKDFKETLNRYTLQGHRVIALSWKSLDPKLSWHQAQRISRDKVEHGMTFVGLLVMQNKLKPQTRPVIKVLKKAKVRTVMITGDMIETAVSVARNCGMVPLQDKVIVVDAYPPDQRHAARLEYNYAEIPSEVMSELSDEEDYMCLDLDQSNLTTHLAINGKSLSVVTNYFPELLSKICVAGTVFARMSPEQKCQLIQKLQELGYHVGMCGDGANDCEALKAAHAGISLSEAEASIAAPFTSKIPHIECVVTVIREGRAALTTSFACFKYMALYSFIQFVSVMILYTFDANLSDVQFLYIDLVITTTIAIFMGYTKAEDKLCAKRPPGSLVKLSNLLSVIVHVILVTLVQVAALIFLINQKWYHRAPENPNADSTKTWETSTLFLVSSYLYMSVAFCFSRGPPFRKPLYTNIPFLIALIVLVSWSTIMILWAPQPILKFAQIVPIWEKDMKFRFMLLVFPVVHFILCWIFEYILTGTQCVKHSIGRCLKKKKRNPYKRVLSEISSINWPPVGRTVYSHLSTGAEEEAQELLNDSLNQSVN